MSGAVIVGVSACLHLALGRWIPSPWFMPDLTVTGMVLAILLLPDRPISPAIISGALMMLCSVAHPLAVGVMYPIVGGLVKYAAGQWDLSQPQRQRAVVVAAQALLLFLTTPLHSRLTGELLWLSLVHLFLTALCVPVVRWAIVAWVPAARVNS